MPRDLPIGNGTVLVNFDLDYRIRDIYYPHLGPENHTDGSPFRMGVWCDGRMSWFGPEWQLTRKYRRESLVTHVVARNESLGIELLFNDAVDFHESVLVRRISVTNLRDDQRQARVFFYHDLRISGTTTGGTAYYDPALKAIVHYKGNRWFGVHTCRANACGVEQFACGRKGMGLEGTWADADDGTLSGNPIDHGDCDSTIGVTLDLGPNSSQEFHYWMMFGQKHADIRKLNTTIHEKGPDELIRRTHNYWSLWVNKSARDLSDLPPPVAGLFKRSLLIMRTHLDNGGAFIAASDWDIRSLADDTYCYVWPRDGAIATYAMLRAGHNFGPRTFFDFCSKIIEPGGYFLHKYNTDGTLASSWQPWIESGRPHLPIQEDGTALVIWALWQFFSRQHDVEFVKPFYRPFIIRAGDFMAKFVNEATGLPLPSHDLWEERLGVHTFTVAAVCGGLSAAANFAEAFGETEHAERYRGVVARMQQAFQHHLFSQAHGRFARSARQQSDGSYELDMTPDSSVYGALLFGACECDDPNMISTADSLRQELWVSTNVGGMARYKGDLYQAVEHDTSRLPGNPWFISTLWYADYLIRQAATADELRQKALPVLEWVADRALPSGVLAEQVNPYTDEPLSVSPLTWSHAAFVIAVLDYLEKLDQLAARGAT